MPGCAAIGCNNRSEKGFTMKCFPRKPLLRAIWKQRVGRADWEPSNNSFLCHAHFESNQRQITQDGKIKLKRDALPSLFTITSTRKSMKKKSKEESDTGNSDECVTEYPVLLERVDQRNTPAFATNNPQEFSSIGGLILQYTSFINGNTLRNMNNENILILAKKSDQGAGNVLSVEKVSILEAEKMKENTQISQNSCKSAPSSVKLEIKEEMAENSMSAHDDGKQRKPENIRDSGPVIDVSTDAEDSLSMDNSPSVEVCSSSNEDEPEILVGRSSHELVSGNMLNIGRKRKRKIKAELIRQDDESVDTSTCSQEIIEEIPAKNSHDIGQESVLKIDPNRRVHKLKVPPSIKNIEDNLQMNIRLRRDCPIPKGLGIVEKTVKVKENQEKANYNQPTSEKLMNKVKVQAEVIEKLTNQLILYKDIEREIRRTEGSQNENNEVEILSEHINSNQSRLRGINSIINEPDLKCKIEILEEKNKKLEEIIIVENHNKQKMESQIKNQSNIIRELNWTLKQTSESLNEAEKNVEHYKQKVLSMQRFLQRNNLSYNNSVFDDLLLSYARQNFSENDLKVALEIETECGIDGYQKLLDYQFPLPSLRELSERYPDEVEYYEARSFETTIGEEEIGQKKCGFPTPFIKSETIGYLNPGSGTCTKTSVLRTVQDLLNEISDDEDMDLSEFQKHIMSD